MNAALHPRSATGFVWRWLEESCCHSLPNRARFQRRRALARGVGSRPRLGKWVRTKAATDCRCRWTPKRLAILGHQLKVGRCLQRDKLFEEPAGLGWLSGAMAATGEPCAERRSPFVPAPTSKSKTHYILNRIWKPGGSGRKPVTPPRPAAGTGASPGRRRTVPPWRA